MYYTGPTGTNQFVFEVPRGPTGPTASVAIGTITTLSATLGATVSNSGTSTAAILNFSIPRGPTGPGGIAIPYIYYTYSVSGLVYTNIGTKRQYFVIDTTLLSIDMYLSSYSPTVPCSIAINKNGIYWTSATIPPGVGNTSSSTSFSTSGLTASKGDYITIDVTSAGGTDLSINILLSART